MAEKNGDQQTADNNFGDEFRSPAGSSPSPQRILSPSE